jgi:uncharacterized protein
MRSTDFPSTDSGRSGSIPDFIRRLALVFCCALPLWSGVALAATPATGNTGAASSTTRAEPAGASRHTRGLLWRIEAPGVKPSYLFGTIHSDDARVTTLPEPVERTLDASRRFIMEAVLDGEGLTNMAESMYFNDDRTLEQVIGKELYAKTLKALVARGISTLGVENQKPWAVMMTLSLPPPRTGEYLDLILEARAAGENKPISGLETVAEQVAVFNDLPLPDQIALLRETVDAEQDLAKEYEELVQTYLARDLTALAQISDRHEPGDDRVYRTVMDRLLTQRNRRMRERLMPILRDGGAFIAVGAAHLPGPTGLLNLIKKAGYRVTPVY